ncbi:MAG: TIGR02186 family protein [Alphaproteobacteria bacterium]|nr:TIGR02186 family protein [Alphaproteobacteria bacterium]
MGRHRLLVWFLAAALPAFLLAGNLRANGLAADVSDRLIAITAAFVGGKVVVFGSVDQAKDDIVITMQGPRQTQTVQRKARIAGIWINRDRVHFEDVPSFFAIASTRPLNELASESVRHQFGLGVDHIALNLSDRFDYSLDEKEAFAAALIRNKQKAGLYTKTSGKVTFPGPKLFRTTFSFPANVTPGHYQIEVLRLKGGQVIDAQQSGVLISKIGMEAEVFDFANQRSALYGMIAIVIAVAAGWLAGVVFRRA